ncbi:MAG: protein kinase domain-containing protein [Planctomycetota bacterium]|jgi:serine/threonine protein kinase
MIVRKIRKDFSLKIASAIICTIFVCNTSLYSDPLPKNTLRVPLQGYKVNAIAIVEFLEEGDSFSINDIEEVNIKLVGEKHINNIGIITQEARYKNRSCFAKWLEGDYKWTARDYKRFIFPQVKHLWHLRAQGIRDIPKIIDVVKDKEGRIMVLTEDLRKLDNPAIEGKGESLADKIKREGVLTPHEALDIIFKVERIVKSLHRKGYIHWDIKPYNIWVTNTGRVILADFDITFGTKEEFIKRTCHKMGTHPYMSKKRWEWWHYGNYDENKDEFPPIAEEVYSLAMTLLHMVIGIKDTRFFNSANYADQQLGLLKEQYEILEDRKNLLEMLELSVDAITDRIKELKNLYAVLYNALSYGISAYESIETFMQALRDSFNMDGAVSVDFPVVNKKADKSI